MGPDHLNIEEDLHNRGLYRNRCCLSTHFERRSVGREQQFRKERVIGSSFKIFYQRQWSQSQISVAKGIRARKYFSLKVHLAVLCRNTIIPSNPPSQPPSAPNITRANSDTRQPERCARHLSNPNMRKAAALHAASQMTAMESGIFKGGGISLLCARFKWQSALATVRS